LTRSGRTEPGKSDRRVQNGSVGVAQNGPGGEKRSPAGGAQRFCRCGTERGGRCPVEPDLAVRSTASPTAGCTTTLSRRHRTSRAEKKKKSGRRCKTVLSVRYRAGLAMPGWTESGGEKQNERTQNV